MVNKRHRDDAVARSNRVERAKGRVKKLLDAGTQFNPAGVSQNTRDEAAANQTREGTGSAAKLSIQLGEKGTARAQKGMQNEFVRKGKLPKRKKKKGA